MLFDARHSVRVAAYRIRTRPHTHTPSPTHTRTPLGFSAVSAVMCYCYYLFMRELLTLAWLNDQLQNHRQAGVIYAQAFPHCGRPAVRTALQHTHTHTHATRVCACTFAPVDLKLPLQRFPRRPSRGEPDFQKVLTSAKKQRTFPSSVPWV